MKPPALQHETQKDAVYEDSRSVGFPPHHAKMTSFLGGSHSLERLRLPSSERYQTGISLALR